MHAEEAQEGERSMLFSVSGNHDMLVLFADEVHERQAVPGTVHQLGTSTDSCIASDSMAAKECTPPRGGDTAPRKSARGRKRRTEPVEVEVNGVLTVMSPEEFRKYRR